MYRSSSCPGPVNEIRRCENSGQDRGHTRLSNPVHRGVRVSGTSRYTAGDMTKSFLIRVVVFSVIQTDGKENFYHH